MSTPDEVLAAALCTLPNTCIEHHHDAELAIAALAAQFVIVPRDATQTDGGPAQPGARPAVTTPPSVANPDEGFAIVRSDELAGLRAVEESDSSSYASQETLSEPVLCSECERPWKRGHECDDGPLDDVQRKRAALRAATPDPAEPDKVPTMEEIVAEIHAIRAARETPACPCNGEDVIRDRDTGEVIAVAAVTPCMRACGHFGPHLPETLAEFVYPSDFCSERTHHPATLEQARAALLDELVAAVRERTERHDSTHTCSSEKVHADLRACLALIQQHREGNP